MASKPRPKKAPAKAKPNPLIVLSSQEVLRFRAWCEQNMQANQQLVEQVKKASLPNTGALVQQRQMEVMAYRIVAAMLGETIEKKN